MSTCSRCRHRFPNPSCHVCGRDEMPPRRDHRAKADKPRSPFELLDEAQTNVAHFQRMVAITERPEKNLYAGLLSLWKTTLAAREGACKTLSAMALR